MTLLIFIVLFCFITYLVKRKYAMRFLEAWSDKQFSNQYMKYIMPIGITALALLLSLLVKVQTGW